MHGAERVAFNLEKIDCPLAHLPSNPSVAAPCSRCIAAGGRCLREQLVRTDCDQVRRVRLNSDAVAA
jgi:hypothetical protein